MAKNVSPIEAEQCENSIKNVIKNAVDTEADKILDLIAVVAMKMSPTLRRLLTGGAETGPHDSNAMDSVMMYLEHSLSTLHSEMNEENFERILDAIWTELCIIFKEILQRNLKVYVRN